MWELLDGSRPGKCRKVRIRARADVVLHRPEGASEFRYVDHDGQPALSICGSAHACPLCARSRSRRAAAELGTAITRHLSASPFADVWMLTLTLPHAPELPQVDQVARLKDAWSVLTSSYEWRRFRKRWGISNVLRSWDCTFGRNGLHGHWHVLLVVDHAVVGFESLRGWTQDEREKLLAFEAADELSDAWLRAGVACDAVTDANRAAFLEHGLRLQPAERSAHYVTRWGIADEVSASGIKRGNQFSLLDAAAAGDARAAELFVEYVDATRGLAVLTGLRAFTERYRVDDAAVAEHLEARRKKEDLAPLHEVRVVIPAYRFAAAIAVGWAAVEAAAAAGGQRAVNALLAPRAPP